MQTGPIGEGSVNFIGQEHCLGYGRMGVKQIVAMQRHTQCFCFENLFPTSFLSIAIKVQNERLLGYNFISGPGDRDWVPIVTPSIPCQRKRHTVRWRSLNLSFSLSAHYSMPLCAMIERKASLRMQWPTLDLGIQRRGDTFRSVPRVASCTSAGC